MEERIKALEEEVAELKKQLRPEKKEFRKSELIQMGYPKTFLERAYRDRGQKIAHKISPKRNSPIVYDIDELERYRRNQCVAW